MYTVIMMAALSSGPATTGQWMARGGGGHATCSCRGCWGCYGGYSGSGYNYMTAHGYQSAFSTYAPVAGALGCHGCYGCYGGWSCYGAPLPQHGTWSEAPAGAAAAPGKDAPKAEETPAPKEPIPAPKEKKEDTSVRARLTLDVPEGAKVYLDGEPMNLKAGRQVFQTPALVAGRVYFYDLRVEVVRDGQVVTENQRVILRPGQMVVAAFPNLSRNNGVVPVANR